MQFVPSGDRGLTRFRVLAIPGDEPPTRYRITHVFGESVFLMQISTKEKAINARRPTRHPIDEVLSWLEQGEAEIGTVRLPSEFATTWPEGSVQALTIQGGMEIIQPLIDMFEVEQNLGRGFTTRVNERADALGMSPTSVRRLLLQYWYFGGMKQCMLGLRRGPKTAACMEDAEPGLPERQLPSPRRRGPKPLLKDRCEPSDWVPRDEDIDDMEAAATRCVRRGHPSLEAIRDAYLRTEFAKRHPYRYQRYLDGQTTVPCSVRMFVYRLRTRRHLPEAVRRAFPSLRSARADRALRSLGPGDVYELDATGGQIVVIDSRDPSKILSRLWIYLLIDRWSRYVVSAYVSLRPPSSESVRKTLRIAFTSRTRRFQLLGIDVDDEKWPPGVVCAQMAVDNGADMIARSTVELGVNDLLIEVVDLPPRCPDGKAIIERVNRTLKAMMKSRGLRGTYDKHVECADDRHSKKKARAVACLSLRDVYRALLEAIEDYNNRPHRTLRERVLELAQNRISPTPKAAYIWGLQHITGANRGVLTHEDYDRLTLQTARATIADGVITWGPNRYYPANGAAWKFGQQGSRKRRAVDVKVDDTVPSELWVVTHGLDWPRWETNVAGVESLGAQTVQEREEFAHLHAADLKEAEQGAHRERLKAAGQRAVRSGLRPSTKRVHDANDVRESSEAESASLDKATGIATVQERPKRRPGQASPAVTRNRPLVTWDAEQQDEMDDILRRLRKEA